MWEGHSQRKYAFICEEVSVEQDRTQYNQFVATLCNNFTPYGRNYYVIIDALMVKHLRDRLEEPDSVEITNLKAVSDIQYFSSQLCILGCPHL